MLAVPWSPDVVPHNVVGKPTGAAIFIRLISSGSECRSSVTLTTGHVMVEDKQANSLEGFHHSDRLRGTVLGPVEACR
jgi:hypothetical protein